MNEVARPKALVVEDDGPDRLALKQQLQLMGIVVEETGSPLEGQRYFDEGVFHLVILHSSRSQQEVLELCRWIRVHSTTPIIMLTKRDEAINEQMAIHAGADDYIIKPIMSKVLTSRVSQQLRRLQLDVEEEDEMLTLTWENLTLDLSQHEFFIGTQSVSLTNSEFRFLNLLMERPQQVFTRDQIVQALGLSSSFGSDHIIDSHASRLRSKVRKNGGPELVHSIRGVGFRLASRTTEITQSTARDSERTSRSVAFAN